MPPRPRRRAAALRPAGGGFFAGAMPPRPRRRGAALRPAGGGFFAGAMPPHPRRFKGGQKTCAPPSGIAWQRQESRSLPPSPTTWERGQGVRAIRGIPITYP
ncbi:MAG: hypothetical protein EI684_10895 [Candidatus Viridilinea halotolerans]|uniref:Uncharacterized protein n=1 Tax=Candidatus Viridilinea halotolerans TaxID=2491704 RepID=A0A426TZL6_9CHLR|nr:MAG: hypothetical protein EI684_10895 [Candidatus Viridilinea halotolerans]